MKIKMKTFSNEIVVSVGIPVLMTESEIWMFCVFVT